MSAAACLPVAACRCTQADHERLKLTPATWACGTMNERPWAEAELVLAECAACGSTLARPAWDAGLDPVAEVH